MRKSAKFWLTAAFVALAGYSLFKGYQAQSRTETPPKQTAYSYSNEKNGTATGSVGTPKVGLEYRVENFSQPEIKVATKVNKLYTNAEFDLKTGAKNFYAETDSKNGEKVKAKASFEDETIKSKVEYEKVFRNYWFENFGLSYTEHLGKQQKRKINLNMIFDFGLGPVEWSPSYDINNEWLNLGRVRRV